MVGVAVGVALVMLTGRWLYIVCLLSMAEAGPEMVLGVVGWAAVMSPGAVCVWGEYIHCICDTQLH